MTKKEFMKGLKKKMSGLAAEERKERLSFYSEMIDDRMEEGMSEEEAVAAVGSAEGIVPEEEHRKSNGLMIALAIVGFPIWMPLLSAAFSVVISLYAVVWSLVVALWAIEVSLAASAFGFVLCAGVFAWQGFGIQAALVVGAGIFCAGVAIFGAFGCKGATVGAARLSVIPVKWIGSLVKRKGNKDA